MASDFQVLLSAEVFLDLDQFVIHAQADLPLSERSVQVLHRFYTALDLIKLFPFSHPLLDYAGLEGKGIRSFSFDVYRAFYQIQEENHVVLVLYIVPQAGDYSAL
jgi:mRNA-degrading endonuclease RelE of RelBE toxin-antitoxin system